MQGSIGQGTQRMPGADALNDEAEMAGVHIFIRYATCQILRAAR
jgi:hypothetical protein